MKKKSNFIDDFSIRMLSCESDNHSNEMELLEDIKVVTDINFRGRDGRTLLIHASTYGCFFIAKYLIEMGADVNVSDDLGYTALHAAVSSRNQDITKLLLENQAYVNALDIHGNNPFFRVLYMDTEIIKLLLRYGGDPFLKNSYGVSAYESLQAHPDIVKIIDKDFNK